jgi:hypothetical protein
VSVSHVARFTRATHRNARKAPKHTPLTHIDASCGILVLEFLFQFLVMSINLFQICLDIASRPGILVNGRSTQPPFHDRAVK